MSNNLFRAVILSLIVVLLSCGLTKENSSAANNTTELTQDKWIEDINYLENNLAKNHINVYHKLSKEEYNKKFEDLKTEVSKLNDYEIKFKLAQIVASIGDAHTSLNVNSQDNDTKIYPFGLAWFGNQLRVGAVDKAYKDVMGSKLVAINDISIDEVMNRINSLISHENDQWVKYINVRYIQNPDILKFLKVAKEDTAEFTFINDEGKTIKLKVAPQVVQKDNVVNITDYLQNKPISKQHDNSNNYDNLYWYKYIPEDKIMYFQYNVCMDRNTLKMAGEKDYEKYPEFEKFGNELIEEINNKKVDKFIIDLRNNTGGNSMLMTNFANRLSKINEINQKGKIFVLTGRETFSSGVMACTDLKDLTNAIFIGEATGGNVNSYGEVLTLTLPNSKIVVSYSTKYFGGYPEYKENFTPDILVDESFGDYVKGIDDVYEAVRNYKN